MSIIYQLFHQIFVTSFSLALLRTIHARITDNYDEPLWSGVIVFLKYVAFIFGDQL